MPAMWLLQRTRVEPPRGDPWLGSGLLIAVNGLSRLAIRATSRPV
jgi:hypothetical protein